MRGFPPRRTSVQLPPDQLEMRETPEDATAMTGLHFVLYVNFCAHSERNHQHPEPGSILPAKGINSEAKECERCLDSSAEVIPLR